MRLIVLLSEACIDFYLVFWKGKEKGVDGLGFGDTKSWVSTRKKKRINVGYV